MENPGSHEHRFAWRQDHVVEQERHQDTRVVGIALDQGRKLVEDPHSLAEHEGLCVQCDARVASR